MKSQTWGPVSVSGAYTAYQLSTIFQDEQFRVQVFPTIQDAFFGRSEHRYTLHICSFKVHAWLSHSEAPSSLLLEEP